MHPVHNRPSARSTGLAERGRLVRLTLSLACCLSLAGCVAVGATLAGMGFTHQMSGIQYRTFTEPLPRVSRATLTALKRMAFKVEGIQQTRTGELFKATAADRRFEVELEALTISTTRMRAIAKNQMGVIVDASTSAEIIRQAELALQAELPKKRPASARAVTIEPTS